MAQKKEEEKLAEARAEKSKMAVMNDEEKAEYIAAKVRYIFVDDAPKSS